MQASLNALYETLRNRVADPTDDIYDRLRGPDLIWVSPVYIAAKPRVVLVGQQQDGWSYSYREFLDEWTIDRALSEYHDFNFGEHYNASPFWQFYNELRRAVFGAESERGVIGWLNLVKFVTRERDPVIDAPFEERALGFQDGIFVRELEIMNPDVCVFTTGPRYDRILERYFPGVRFEETCLAARLLAAVKHERLPQKSFRTYHPKSLRFQKLWQRVLGDLIDSIVPRESAKSVFERTHT
jgi:hypothetical protein